MTQGLASFVSGCLRGGGSNVSSMDAFRTRSNVASACGAGRGLILAGRGSEIDGEGVCAYL